MGGGGEAGEERWCVVTGGRGFAARHLVEMLIRYDMFLVRVADLGPTVRLDSDDHITGVLPSALDSGRAVYVSADLRDKSQLLKAFQGAEVVFHMAAPNSSVNDHQLHYSVNVLGTKNVIDACVESNVRRLIYTSSASVVFDGIHGILNGDETLPYPAKPLDSYSATKSEAEALILKANGTNGILTCSLRPSSIFGPGDRLFIPSLVAAGRAGKSKFIIGDGNNVYDFTYVENVAHSHVCAERALASGGEVANKAAGQAYFITNMVPMKFWDFTSYMLGGLGYERPRIKVPASVMMPIAHVVDGIYKVLGPYGMKVPQLIPSRIRLLSCSRSFNCSKAKELLGYTPIVPLEEGLKTTVESFSHLHAENQPKREGPSKAYVYLGNGKVANTLLWKDKKQTLVTLLVLVAIYYNFITSQCTIIATLSKLLMLASVFLFVHGVLPQKMLGYNIEKVPQSSFQLSEEKSQRVAGSMASTWNATFSVFRSLCKGNDWTLFLKVPSWSMNKARTRPVSLIVDQFASGLSEERDPIGRIEVTGLLVILGVLGSISFHSVFIVGVLVAFTAFYVYERNEEAIDAMFLQVLSRCGKLRSQTAQNGVESKKSE